MVYQTLHLFSQPHLLSFYGFVFFGTLCSYNFHWFLTPTFIPGPVSTKTNWNQRNKKLHLAIAVAALLAAFYFFFLLQQHWVWLLLTGVFTFLYSAPKLPMPPFTHLISIAYGKTVFLALAWMHITAMLPLLLEDIVWQPAHYLFCVNRFFLIYGICILFDLRDRSRDKKEGIKSMVTQYTPVQVDVLFWGVMLTFFITSIGLITYFSWGVVLALWLPGFLVALFYNWFKQQHADYVYYFILDGLMIFSLPLLLLFRF